MKNYFLFLLLFTASSNAQSFWGQLPTFPGTARSGACMFMIGDTVYAGTGRDNDFGPAQNQLTKDFFKYDPATNSWTAIADIPGERWMCNGFSIGNKGYVVFGVGVSGTLNELWEYSPNTNTWTPKTSCPGSARWSSFCFVANGKAYIGCGTNNGDYSDMWEYDPNTDQWTQKANFIGPRYGMVSFSINNKGYVGLGVNGNNYYDDLWMYDPNLDSWTQKANFPDTSRIWSTGFAVNNKGYFGLGCVRTGTTNYCHSENDFWEYDPIYNAWWSIANIPSSVRYQCAATSNGNIAYIFGGVDIMTWFLNDFYKYPYFVTTGVAQLVGNDLISVISKNKDLTIKNKTRNEILLTLHDMTGKIIYEHRSSDAQQYLDLKSLPDQILIYRAMTKDGKSISGKFFLYE